MASTDVRLYITPAELREGAALALKHRLYVPGWTLFGVLVGLRNARFTCQDQLAMTFVDGEPVALAVYEKWHHQVMAFTKRAHRLRGYGTMAVSELRFDRNIVFADEGVRGTRQFWRSAGVGVRTYRF